MTTDTEIMSMEILKHRHLGQFMDRTQYLMRKVVIPLELPKTVRGMLYLHLSLLLCKINCIGYSNHISISEVTSIRSGLRKRKLAESPLNTEPQVTEEWLDEEKLELWNIRQYGELLERQATQTVTRARSGVTASQVGALTKDGNAQRSDSPLNVVKGNPIEIKEKMEQQLRLQRAAHQQKRALEGGSPQLVKMGSGQVVKLVPSQTQGKSFGITFLLSFYLFGFIESIGYECYCVNVTLFLSSHIILVLLGDGTVKMVAKVAIPASPGSNQQVKTALTSLLNNGTGNKNVIGTRRVFMTKNADGARVISGPTSILPKGNTVQLASGQQSLIKIQPQPGQAQTTVQIQGSPQTPQQTPQRVQILKQPDGKIQVKGLMPGTSNTIHFLLTSFPSCFKELDAFYFQPSI